VSALQQTVKFVRLIVIVSTVLTIFCAVVIFGGQVVSWTKTGVWEAYPLSAIVEGLKNEPADVYVTASSVNFQSELTIREAIVDWILGIPTTAILLVVAALHLVFYLYLSSTSFIE
jgi:hypothetical protein